MIYYSEDHEWVLVEDGVATIGITDFAQEQLGDLVFIDLPDVDEEVDMGDSICVIESVKAASDLIAPVSGTIIEVNGDLEDEPELVNEAAMSHWILKIKLADESQLDDLMNEEDYQNRVDDEE